MGQEVNCRRDRAVPAADYDRVVPLEDGFADRLGEAGRVGESVAGVNREVQAAEMVEGLLEGLLPGARARVHYEGRTLHARDCNTFAALIRASHACTLAAKEREIPEEPMTRQPVPPFDEESARQKVEAAEDDWNTRDPEKIALAYAEDSQWRNRDEFFNGRHDCRQFVNRGNPRLCADLQNVA